MPRSLVIAWLALLGWLPPSPTTSRARAESPLAQRLVITFEQGGTVVLPAVCASAEVVVLGPQGPVRFARSDVLQASPHVPIEKLWPRRREEALRQGGGAPFGAAVWALEHGLPVEAVALLEAIGSESPAHEPAQRMLRAARHWEQPCPAGTDDRALPAACAGMKRLAGRHLVLAHQADDQAARRLLETLDQVCLAFHLDFARLGRELDWPEQRLLVVWFPAAEPYRAFLRNLDAAGFLNTRGFTPDGQRLVAFHGRLGDADPAATCSLLDAHLAARGRSVPLPLTESRALRDRDRRRLLGEVQFQDQTLSIAIHELVHALTLDSGLAPTMDALPTWVHEGLAMQYEWVEAGRWSGIGRENPERSLALHRLQPEPLEAWLRRLRFDPGYHQAAYAQAWGWVNYLRDQEPERFLAFLDRLASTPSATLKPATVRQTFEATLGTNLHEHERCAREHLETLARTDSPHMPAPDSSAP